MFTSTIGENAGKVWKTLHEKGEVRLSSIKSATSLKEEEMYMALGWLAREGKLKFKEKQSQVVVALTSK